MGITSWHRIEIVREICGLVIRGYGVQQSAEIGRTEVNSLLFDVHCVADHVVVMRNLKPVHVCHGVKGLKHWIEKRYGIPLNGLALVHVQRATPRNPTQAAINRVAQMATNLQAGRHG